MDLGIFKTIECVCLHCVVGMVYLRNAIIRGLGDGAPVKDVEPIIRGLGDGAPVKDVEPIL